MIKKFLFFLMPFLTFFLGVYLGLFFEWNKNEYYDRNGLWPMLTADDKGFVPVDGFIPDEKTALRVAKNIWSSIYGLEHLILYRYKYRVRLVDNSVWVIEGVSKWGGNGGGPFIKIDKSRGTILEVTHTF
jgi:hypothetical protein